MTKLIEIGALESLYMTGRSRRENHCLPSTFDTHFHTSTLLYGVHRVRRVPSALVTMCPTAPVSNGSSMMGSVVAPSLGTIICFFMWLSPMTAVLEARKVRGLLSCGPSFWSLRGTPPVHHHHMY